MREKKSFRFVFAFFGLVLGIILLLFDRYLDTHSYFYIYSWSVAILAYIIFGIVIGNLSQRLIKEQRKREDVVKIEQQRLYNLLRNLPGIVNVLEESGQIRFANRNSIIEFGECEGKYCYHVFGRRSLCNNCVSETVFNNEKSFMTKELIYNDRMYEVMLQPFSDIDGSKLVIQTLYDVTERKKAEKELSRMQADLAHLERLNLVGQLAAGIAHEIRNPMTVVKGYLQLLESKPEVKPYCTMVKTMISELDRANSIISEFLSLARNRPTEQQNQNLNVILRYLFPLLEADTFFQNKQIVFEAGETPDLPLNFNEICQLVLNLCRNGLESMQEGQTLTIRTYVEDENVVLSVEDEGCGIAPENLDKLGIRFFTTKENGTGIGLTTCYSIAERHQAKIHVESSPNGTIFLVRFPLIQ